MEKKLAELRDEYRRGQQHLDLLDRQRQETRDTLLRISGAILVLEDLLQQKTNAPDHGGALAKTAPVQRNDSVESLGFADKRSY